MKQWSSEKPHVYSALPRVAFGEKYSLMLLGVTPEDSGSYECAISANIGGRNLDVRVALVVNGELPVCISCWDLHKAFRLDVFSVKTSAETKCLQVKPVDSFQTSTFTTQM